MDDELETRTASSAERQAPLLRLIRETGVAAGESPTFVAAMQIILDRVCAHTGAPVGHALLVDENTPAVARSARVWCVDRRRFTQFCAASEAGAVAAGQGVCGRALVTRRAAWVADVDGAGRSPREAALAALGIRAGFAFPVLVENEVVAVLEFYGGSGGAPDAPFLDAIAAIAAQLAQVFERERMARALRRTHEWTAAVFDAAVEPMITLEGCGRILLMNPAAERTFGYRTSELRDHAMVDRLVAASARETFATTLDDLAACESDGPGSRRLELVGVRRDGVEFPMALMVTRVRRRANAWVIVHLRDAIESRRAERRLAIQYGVAHALAASSSLANAAPAIVRALADGLGATACAVWSSGDGDEDIECLAAWGSSRPEIDAWMEERARARGDDLVRRVFASGDRSWIAELAEAGLPWSDRARRLGLRSAFAFPVCVAGEVLAVVEIFRADAVRPDGDLVEVCAALGSQIGQFVGRARSQRALEEREAWLAMLFDHALDVITELDEDGTIRSISPSVERVLGYKPEDMIGRPVWEHVHPDDLGVSVAAVDAAMSGDGKLVTAETRVRHKEGSWRFVEGIGTRLPSHAPRKGAVIINIRDVTERKQGEEALRGAEERVRKHARRLSRLTRQLMEREEAHRLHLARELHDEIGQSLRALKIHLLAATAATAEPASRLGESIAIVERTLDQVRSLSLDLRPPLLDDVGLVAALRWHVDRQAQLAGWKVRFVARIGEDDVTPVVATTCFRVAQEALTNVMRHARAAYVEVALRREPQRLSLVVRDDGAGFDLEDVQSRGMSGAHLGLLGMRERVALLGGALAITSAPGRGTEVRAELPLGATQQGGRSRPIAPAAAPGVEAGK
jgi:PAS domain S-box-containing protein